MMKRKAEKQQTAAPVSAFAARKARLQQTQTVVATEKTTHTAFTTEPPSKRPRRSLEETRPQSRSEEKKVAKRGIVKTGKVTRTTFENGTKAHNRKAEDVAGGEDDDQSSSDESGEDMLEENAAVLAVPGAEDGYESPADTPALTMEFPLSKTRLNKNNIVYSDEDKLCVRIREKMSIALIGHYDLWVKRGVVSLMGAKLHPSPRVYRVYAPSTHSLPVIKCVSGVEGAAEIEFKSCHSGIYRLRDLSHLYQRVWNGANSPADKLSLKQVEQRTRRTFSVLHTSADDPLKRHLRPLHLEKQWSATMKTLSQRAGRLQVLVCGPKSSGKSTFSRYLLNHLLSPAPRTETNYYNTDGVAFLDLDPGQPEFSPMGQVYLAHLRSPVFGPQFTHPSLNNDRDGAIIRAHHIGATSPKEDPDHYVLAATNLMKHYRALLATYPQCPLIINYPGWIFGLGLEVATYLVRSLGLSDVVYMSEKGPMEVVEPLHQAASTARIPLTILPSQPTEFVSRSSAQLRSMQMQSYFHMSQPKELNQPCWLEKPVFKTRPFHVRYAGPDQGIHGIMVLGSQLCPDLLSDSLEGSVVGIVAVESPNALPTPHPIQLPLSTEENEPTSGDGDGDGPHNDADIEMTSSADDPSHSSSQSTIPTLASLTTPTKENLPYLLPPPETGTSTPLHPSYSTSLGLALIHSINPENSTIALSTPIPPSRLRQSLEQGHALVLVRGLVDNPNWAVAEEYVSAKAAERRARRALKSQAGDGKGEDGDGEDEKGTRVRLESALARAKERVRRAKNVPFMTVVEDHGRRRQDEVERERGGGGLWKLRKKAIVEEESEVGY